MNVVGPALADRSSPLWGARGLNLAEDTCSRAEGHCSGFQGSVQEWLSLVPLTLCWTWEHPLRFVKCRHHHHLPQEPQVVTTHRIREKGPTSWVDLVRISLDSLSCVTLNHTLVCPPGGDTFYWYLQGQAKCSSGHSLTHTIPTS